MTDTIKQVGKNVRLATVSGETNEDIADEFCSLFFAKNAAQHGVQPTLLHALNANTILLKTVRTACSAVINRNAAEANRWADCARSEE